MRKEKNVTKEMAVDSLCAFYSRNKRVPRQCEAVKRNGLYSYSLYYRVLGCDSWRKVLDAAELKYFIQTRGVTKEMAIDSLCAFYKQHGRTPGCLDASRNNGLYVVPTYLKVLGCDSWGEVIKKSGLPPFKKKIPEDAIVTKEQAEESLIMFYKKHNRRPLVREGYASFQLHSIATYKKIFEEKNWKQLLDKVGLPGKNKTKQRNL